MSRVLLLVDPVHPMREATRRAVEAARGGALHALAVIDREALGSLRDEGILGIEPTRAIADALVASARERAEERIAQVAAAAAAAGVPFESALRDGDPAQVCVEEIRARGIDRVIVPARRRSRLARLWAASGLDAAEARASCPFEYVGET